MNDMLYLFEYAVWCVFVDDGKYFNFWVMNGMDVGRV